MPLAAIMDGDYIGSNIVVNKPQSTVELIMPDDIPTLPSSKTMSGGGGGGGDRDKLQASPGRLPKQSMQQITPPMAVVRNPEPELPGPPTSVISPEVHPPQPNLPDLGQPLFALASLPSSGTGAWGGTGGGIRRGVG